MSANKKALVIVNMQKDFCAGGVLAVPDADSIVPIINKYIEGFKKGERTVFAARDLHTEDSALFEAFGGKWPPHCVEGTAGAEFHGGLKLPDDAIIITRGLDLAGKCENAFSGSDEFGRTFQESLLANGVSHIYLAGLATDRTIKETALEGRKLGFAVTLLIDAVRAFDQKHDGSEIAIGEMRRAGVNTRDYSCLVIQLSRPVFKVNE